MISRKQYRKEMERYEIERAVEESLIEQPVVCRKATAQEMCKTGNKDFIPYENNYDFKYNLNWKDFEKKMYSQR